MALQWTDSFDTYATAQLNSAWPLLNSGVTVQSSVVRTGANALSLNALTPATGVSRSFGADGTATNPSTVIVGCAYQPNVLGSFASGQNCLIALCDGGTGDSNIQISLGVNSDGSVFVRRGSYSSGTVLGTSVGGLVPNGTFTPIEMKVVFATGATGSVTVQVNGIAVITIANVQTAATTNASASCYVLGQNTAHGNVAQGYVDDFYVFDGTGTANTNMLGDWKVTIQTPASSGRVTSWGQNGGTGGSPWTAVDEIPPDGDTSYISSATPGSVEDFGLTALASATTIFAVTAKAYARKDDSGTRTIGLGVGNNTTENFDAGQNLTTAYMYYGRPMDQNPLTTAAWATGDFTGAAAIQLALKELA